MVLKRIVDEGMEKNTVLWYCCALLGSAHGLPKDALPRLLKQEVTCACTFAAAVRKGVQWRCELG